MNNVYIFDLGNVLFKYNPYDLCEPYVTNQEEKAIIVKTLFNLTYWNRLDDGNMVDEEYKEMMKYIIPNNLYDKAMLIFDEWQSKMPEIEGIKAILLKLKARGDKLYVLSNISISYEQNYVNYPKVNAMLALFDGIVMSGSVKLMKPDPRIYQYIIDKYNIDVSKAHFIDDKLPNVLAAESFGIKGHQFLGDIEKLKEFCGL